MKIYLILVLLFYSYFANSQVQVFPTRLTLSDQTRSSYLNLRNTQNKSETFEIELVQYKMKQDGSYTKSESIPQDHPLLERLKFSPKTVQLGPGEKQVVRVMVSDFDEMQDGEYYLHLQAVPQKSENERSEKESKKASMQLNARIAVAIPIVVRKGKLISARPEIMNASYFRLKNGDLQLRMDIKKSGIGFVIGDLEIFSKKQNILKSLSVVKGISSYIEQRGFQHLIENNLLKDFVELENNKIKSELIYIFKSNQDSTEPFELTGEFLFKEAQAERKTSTSKKNKKSVSK